MKKILLFSLFTSLLVLSSCDNDDPDIPNEEEVITTLVYTLASSDGSDVVELRFEDLDGEGGDAPVVTNGTLQANTTYSGVLTLLNEQEEPAENITEEIEEEDEEHQFFFESTVSGLSVAYNDADADGFPIGLSSVLTTGDAADGVLSITLKHDPVKDASGVSDGDITNSAGEIDIEVDFNITVE